MHFWHALLVKAATPEDAELAVGRFLEGYRGSVWDFYNVGEQLTGTDGGDTLVVRGNEDKVRAAIETQLATQKKSLHYGHTKLLEKAGEIAAIVTPQENYETKGDPTVQIWAGKLLELVGKLAADEYCAESWFWDVEAGNSYLTEERWGEIVAEGDSYWLVNVDLHRETPP